MLTVVLLPFGLFTHRRYFPIVMFGKRAKTVAYVTGVSKYQALQVHPSEYRLRCNNCWIPSHTPALANDM